MPKYFVSYYYTDGPGFGFGNSQVICSEPLDGVSGTAQIEKYLRDEVQVESLVIINFIKLEDTDATQDTE